MCRVIENSPDSPIMTPKECAKAMHVSESKIRKMCQDGDIVAVKFGAIWRINRKKFMEFCKLVEGSEPNEQAAS